MFWKGISVTQMTEAASVYCKYLKGAAKIIKFAHPMRVLGSSLGAWRETALMAVAGLGNAVVEGGQAGQGWLRRNWGKLVLATILMYVISARIMSDANGKQS